MKLVLADATYLKDSVGVISELVTEARFNVSRDGMEMIAMDPANVAMVIFKLLAPCFMEFELDAPEEMTLNLASLKQVLRRASPADILTLTKEDSQLKIQLRGKSTRTFSLPLLDADQREQKIPNLTFPLSIEMPSAVLSGAIEDGSIFAEAVSFSCDKDKFNINGEGDSSKATIEMRSGEEAKITTQSTADVKAKYSVEYLKKIINGSKLAETVQIQFNQDYPLRIDYTVIDRLQLSFILAPRVEND